MLWPRFLLLLALDLASGAPPALADEPLVVSRHYHGDLFTFEHRTGKPRGYVGFRTIAAAAAVSLSLVAVVASQLLLPSLAAVTAAVAGRCRRRCRRRCHRRWRYCLWPSADHSLSSTRPALCAMTVVMAMALALALALAMAMTVAVAVAMAIIVE